MSAPDKANERRTGRRPAGRVPVARKQKQATRENKQAIDWRQANSNKHKHKRPQLVSPRIIIFLNLLFIFQLIASRGSLGQSAGNAPPGPPPPQQAQPNELEARARNQKVPTPVQSASYVSPDGLTLVVIFNRPLNLSASIESVEQRHAAAEAHGEPSAESETRPGLSHLKSTNKSSTARPPRPTTRDKEKLASQVASQAARQTASQTARRQPNQNANRKSSNRLAPDWAAELLAASSELSPSQRVCPRDEPPELRQETPHLIGGVQLCAHLLTRKTLKLLHKHRLVNCLWASQVQFLVQLGRPAGGLGPSQPVRVAFRRGTLSEARSQSGQDEPAWNEQEVGLDLVKLPLEGLGVPLSPRLALTGPNQVPPCGQFSITAHLSSPYGTRPDESVKLRWSVERRGLIAASNSSSAAGPTGAAQASTQPELVELQWQALRALVARERSNNLVLEARLLQFVPQLYEFKLEATFTTSLTSFNLNASHQVGRLDFDTPIGTIYGTHLLALEQQLNTNQELGLLADVQVPECARNIKQIGLYWQVSDPRVRFEQTYAPYYLAKSNTLPEQALIEFRLNLFYGIRVKKFASAGTLVPTGESLLDAQISDGLLMASLGQPQDLIGGGGGGSSSAGDQSTAANHQQLELFAISRDRGAREQQDKFTYQWSCFDGKTAQPCYKSLKVQASSGGTRYDVGTPLAGAGGRGAAGQSLLARPQQDSTTGGAASSNASPLLLVDRARQRQPALRLPLSWLDSDAQLWFGLQRFDRANPSQHSKTEYALVSVHPVAAGGEHSAQGTAGGGRQAGGQPIVVSIGPVLVGRARQRATLRNPLTGAIVLIANAPALVVGRLSPAEQVATFHWHSPNFPHPLNWISRNVTNPLNGQEEILTELHLDRSLLLGHAHHQLQLTVCSAGGGGQRSTASVSLDVVQGVSECKVELLAGSRPARAQLAEATEDQLPLVVTVNYCNIPLGLSPITYQLYVIDTSGSDGLTEASRPAASQAGGPEADEDYLNEADELFYEAQAQPLTLPQLSPVFSLGAMNAMALTALVQPLPPPQGSGDERPPARFRFAARVCDRLPSCQMFYSGPLDPLGLAGGSGPTASDPNRPAPSLNESLALGLAAGQPLERLLLAQAQQGEQTGRRAGKGHAQRALKQMLEAAKRANTAGNSMAAISIVNALLQLGQRLLASNQAAALGPTGGRQRARQSSGVRYSSEPDGEEGPRARQQESDRATPARATDAEGAEEEARLRDVLQVAMRDCLFYGAQSIQRHFHYTESGQTNLVLAALARVLVSPQAGFEFKFRSLRLISLLVRKSLDGQPADSAPARLLAGRAAAAPDLKTLQLAYESLFGSIGQHSIGGGAGVAAAHPAGGVRGQEAARATTSKQSGTDEIRSAAGPDENNKFGNKQNGTTSSPATGDLSEDSSADRLLSAAAHQPHQQQVAASSGGLLRASNRRNKEESIQALLKLARATHRLLLQSAASQLALGSAQSLQFNSAGGAPALSPARSPTKPLAQQAPPPPSSSTTNILGNQNNNFAEANKFLASEQPPAYIVSSLTHSTELPTSGEDSNLEIDLRDFGQVGLRFNQRLGPKLARTMRQARLMCLNESSPAPPARCSSFVLAVSSFAGKSPFRSLDRDPQNANRLALPIVQLDWLSPLDGSNLVELLGRQLAEERAKGHSATHDDQLTLEDFRASVTFALPPGGQDEAPGREPLRCYKFDEAAGEWAPLPTSREDTKLRCAFEGFGAVGAFRGKPPPPADASAELSIALGLGLVLAIVSLFSLLGCMASRAKGAERRRGGSRSHRNQRRGELSADDSSASHSKGSTNSLDESELGEPVRHQSRSIHQPPPALRHAATNQAMAFR